MMSARLLIKPEEPYAAKASYALSPLPAFREGLGVGCNDCGNHN
ncbi:hypothetical protein GXM_00249 [Nostoc sphaeroides CCNUC1]|uniref:Uncharacterized protein n=1 Tax=Nostoc sphaeroides CCNUC1 TaxID=2653204 RepID=A0A5P8VRA7_9NOSO|nr:hypothetical protein GXM_00249 [Nostoc sphaeroides CCNUC1]